MPIHMKNAASIILWMAALMLSGCAGRPLVVEKTPWFDRSSGAYDTSDGRVFYGIGMAGGTRNATLLRATAANNSRKEMALVLNAFVFELFQSTGTLPSMTPEEREQLMGTLVRNALKRAVISDHWFDAGQMRRYALCRLDLDVFKQVLASQTAIDAETRDAMWAEAENVHARIEGLQQ